MKYPRFPVLALLALAASQAHAIPVTYSITGSGIYDNPVGTFTYDAATNRYTNVSIWSLDYYSSAVGNAEDTLLRATGVMGTTLRLVFSDALTDLGGNLTFSGYERGLLTMYGRLTRTGTASSGARSSGASVPEPSAALLLLLGLAGVWFAPRRLASKPR